MMGWNQYTNNIEVGVKMTYTPPTPAQLQGFVDACDVDSIRELHEEAKQAVNDLKKQMSELTTAQHEIERQAISIKEAKNKLAIIIREHRLNADTIKDAMFAAIDRRKNIPKY
jgi:hypothetical protein